MKIYVDADACPKVIREIVIRAAERTGIATTFVTNQALRLNVAPHIALLQVPDGPDIADAKIVELCEPGDLVITADIPFAAQVVGKGATALDPAGRLFTPENIKQILNMRDFMDSIRGSGAIEQGGGGGGPAFGPKQRQEFSNQLDKHLAKAKR
ncbi:MAG TPA: YaiI/YqxD family protein [Patescibacteria group bacterium]|nr:YaiI/YqxD family protein [Patescibacteria group bacterium]